MTKERPPTGLRGEFESAPVNDVEARTEGAISEAHEEFEFSRLVLGQSVPFEVPPERVERTWARLSHASAGTAELTKARHDRRRHAGPLLAFAACVATFVVGVWVGEGNVGGRSAGFDASRGMSAEPVGVALPSGEGVVPSRRGESIVLEQPSRQDAVSANQASEVRAFSADDPERAARSTGTTRAAANVRPSVHLAGTTMANGVVPLPVNTEDAVAVTPSAVVLPRWQRLAKDGDDDGALIEIATVGGFEHVLQSASAEQLMLLSDVARGTGQLQRALAALRRIVSEHPSDPVAPLAAFNMGNLLDKMGDGAGAAQAFAVYRALSPQGEFAEDALVGQLRSAVSAGQQGLARRLVRQYEADFPEGRRADEVARWAEQIPTESESGDAGSAAEEAE